MPHSPVLYLGDTDLNAAASYLAGLMTHWRWRFDYAPSNQLAPDELLAAPRRLFILSDYPARMLDSPSQNLLLKQINAGAGLVMIGGWESFHGESGHWNKTPLADALPTHISDTDDRINCDQTTLAIKTQNHPITDNLPWDDRPPTIGGFNALKPKPGASVLLNAQRFTAQHTDGNTSFEPRDTHPLLITATHGKGRTAALATDIAPHWVGGLVDWGPSRVSAHAPGSTPIEVGCHYATFARQLLAWVGRLDNHLGN